ncbi:uncharacterized protein RNJ42_02621 [Nakaseomyces bracarensis]|uniref:uncharacterized protein n=1 Tax=Nakaseomyces bracarensis TaxID=273131 RepID=UPI0038719BAC
MVFGIKTSSENIDRLGSCITEASKLDFSAKPFYEISTSAFVHETASDKCESTKRRLWASHTMMSDPRNSDSCVPTSDCSSSYTLASIKSNSKMLVRRNPGSSESGSSGSSGSPGQSGESGSSGQAGEAGEPGSPGDSGSSGSEESSNTSDIFDTVEPSDFSDISTVSKSAEPSEFITSSGYLGHHGSYVDSSSVELSYLSGQTGTKIPEISHASTYKSTNNMLIIAVVIFISFNCY